MQSNSYFQPTRKRNEGTEQRDRKRSQISKLTRLSMRTNRNHKESSYAYSS